MKDLIEEIQLHFASSSRGLRKLQNTEVGFDAYTFRTGVEFGVAIEVCEPLSIYEEASQITIKCMNFLDKNFIVLSCIDEMFRNDFAKLSLWFIEPGRNGENRNNILNAPLVWWSEWIQMLGNKLSSRSCYDTIAEMQALYDLYKSDKSIVWSASHSGSHDIESSTASFEVKSTTKKSDSKITISSQFQLDSENPLQLWFFRMEQTELGESINDIKSKLVRIGYDDLLIESQLEHRGFIMGSSIRDVKYGVLEKRIYNVDDDFPRITASSFKGDVFPKNIVKIQYTIDLEGLKYYN